MADYNFYNKSSKPKETKALFSEDHLQTCVVNDIYYLRRNNWNITCFAVPNANAYSGVISIVLPNKRTRQIVMNRIQGLLNKIGFRAGAPDLIIIFDGKTYFLELKRPTIRNDKKILQRGGELSEDQINFQKEIMYCGVLVTVLKSLEEWHSFLESIGFQTRWLPSQTDLLYLQQLIK